MARDEKELKSSLDNLTAAANNPKVITTGLGLLFPKIRQAFGIFVSESPSNPVLGHRISRSEFASAYFGLDPHEATWERSELENLLRSDKPRTSLRELVEKTERAEAPEQDKLRLRSQLLDALGEGFEAKNPQLSIDWFRAVLDVSPVFIRARDVKSVGFLYATSNEERMRWLLVRPMQVLSPEERGDLIRANINGLLDVSLLCTVFRSIAGDASKDGATPPYGHNALGDETDKLREQLVDHVREIAREGRFWTQALPGNILWFWRNSGHEQEVRDFTSLEIHNRAVMTNLLELPVSEVRSTAGNYEQVQMDWDKIIDLEALDEVANMLESTGNDKERKVAQRYARARERGRESNFP